MYFLLSGKKKKRERKKSKEIEDAKKTKWDMP